MLATLPFSLNFAHPLAEWGLLAVGGWALYLGIKAKKTRTGTPEQRKELVPKKFAQRHYLWGSILLAVMTCLLYTSPSPRDVEESRMPSSA